jgi:serine/threonine protein kinase
MTETLPRPFGSYTLLKRIALGGMAELFFARGPDPVKGERDVVVKRILPNYSGEEAFVRMFVDEASLTSKLKHPNIIEIYDFDVVEGQYYIAMEFVQGADLTDILERCVAEGTRLSVAQCVTIAIELARGLDYAHRKEHRGKPMTIIHRDISPHNAMITWEGHVKLMDFGIAKAAERSTKTQAGMVKGKVAYMSPEQARGKALDGRSDLFALGVVLWELLTLDRLWQRETDFEALTAIMKEPAPPPSSLNDAVDPELDRIVLTALEKDRDWRQADAATFIRQLTAWQEAHAPDPEVRSLRVFMQTLYREKLGDQETPEVTQRSAGTIVTRESGLVGTEAIPERGRDGAEAGLFWPVAALTVLGTGVAALSWSLL